MSRTIGSLFAGIGGFDLGFERAGFATSWACEIDPKAQAVLRLRFPNAALHDDVRLVGAHNLAPVDVITFGSPCQDLSVAGKRAGLAGERSGLFHEAARVIRECRERYGKPDFAIWENVPGAFSSNGGRDFGAVLQTLAELGARDIAWRVLDSRFFNVAQRRRRVFLVADFGGERAEQVLALAESGPRNPASRRQARQGLASGAKEVAGSSSWQGANKDTAHAVTCHAAKGGDPTTDNYAACSLGIRRITPTESERLQGFPDGWTAEGIDASGKRIPMADSSRYRQLGNAVTVNVAHWLAKRIAAVYDASEVRP